MYRPHLEADRIYTRSGSRPIGSRTALQAFLIAGTKETLDTTDAFIGPISMDI